MADSKHVRRPDRVPYSSAVSSVSFSRPNDTQAKMTKTGAFIYSGSPSLFYEWEFRTRLKVREAGTDAEKYAGKISSVVEGLRDDAFILAKELGFEAICHPGKEVSSIIAGEAEDDLLGDSVDERPAGVDVLIDAMKTMVFPRVDQEAKELFKQYLKNGGSLSRQSGESMQHYVSRRKRVWNILQELPSSFSPTHIVLH